jgi:dTDP-4-amino-4,6-dideoxygalactose transaminase
MPVTVKISERTVALPFFNNRNEKQINDVVKAVEEFFKGKEVKR